MKAAPTDPARAGAGDGARCLGVVGLATLAAAGIGGGVALAGGGPLAALVSYSATGSALALGYLAAAVVGAARARPPKPRASVAHRRPATPLLGVPS